jgi:hypothetical protein
MEKKNWEGKGKWKGREEETEKGNLLGKPRKEKKRKSVDHYS